MPANFFIFIKFLICLFSMVFGKFSHFNTHSSSVRNSYFKLYEHDEPLWMRSGKFQGDIDGVDREMVKQNPNIMYNALKNKQLTWINGIIPYKLDEEFTPSEVKLLQSAFKTYRKRTCIRFRIRESEPDFLNVIKGHGCYSQVGKTGGKQEISLGRGCLFNETIIHELMHSIGFWHEHSRSDRDEHIIIQWENIAPGMDSQFDIVSPAIQDTLGERYDYRSIMHYGFSAFSKNGRNTIEAMNDDFTAIIGTATDLSELDVAKINKLYRCAKREPRKFSLNLKKNRRKNRIKINSISKSESSRSGIDGFPSQKINHEYGYNVPTTTPFSEFETSGLTTECLDHFVDCPNFKDYCHKLSFFFIMKSYCPFTCGQCEISKD